MNSLDIKDVKVLGETPPPQLIASMQETAVDADPSEIQRRFAEDAYVCRKIDAELKSNGIKFASVGHARAFSVENMLYTGQFGFHGRGTLIMNKTQNSMPMPPWLDL